jgi:NADP-dependent 3-hydroxy acid dehydrogenase YdfG
MGSRPNASQELDHGEVKWQGRVITGWSSGIGLAAAEAFVDEGAYVFIAGRRQSGLDEAKATIGVRLGRKYYIGTF